MRFSGTSSILDNANIAQSKKAEEAIETIKIYKMQLGSSGRVIVDATIFPTLFH